MKNLLALVCAAGFVAVPTAALAAPKGTQIQIRKSVTGLFPVSDFDLILAGTAHDLVAQALIEQCGENPQVTDLDVRTIIHHNEVPGAASAEVVGTAICVLHD
jgi:hypothetical protein